MSITLDGLNINTTSTPTAGYLAMEPIDWGGKAISDIVNSGQYRLEDMDAVLSAGRVLRQVVIPLKILGTSADDLDSKIAAINVKLAKASRFAPVSLVVTPQGSSATSTFKVVGGSLDDGNASASGVTGSSGWWTKVTDSNYRVTGNLVLQTLPFVYGARQTYGSSGSPFLTATATPTNFVLTPTHDGDVLNDVTVVFLPTSNPVKALTLGCVPQFGNSWTTYLDFSSFSHGSGASFSTVSNAKYLSGAGVGVTLSAQNTLTTGVLASAGLGSTDLPTQVPFRLFAIVDDVTTTAANRGLNQFRARVWQNQSSIGDWCVCPPGAYSGASHYSQVVDLGTFTFPPGPVSDQTTYSASTNIYIDMQTSNASPTQIVFDALLLVPDLTSIVAEWPNGSANTSTATRVENSMLFDTFGQSQTVVVTGAHIRSRGVTNYGIWASGNVLASQTADTTYETVKAWLEVTPRYLGLAPA